MVLRDRDTDDNGSLDEKVWYCQNRHYDVVALIEEVGGEGHQLEMVRYSAYGVPFGLPAGDADSDGDCDDGDTVDTDQIQTWITAESYDVRGDLDLDGDVDATDKSAAATGVSLGRSNLSNTANILGMSGRPWAQNSSYDVRYRRLHAELGRWTRRDPLGYVDGLNVYEPLRGNPLRRVDPMGLASDDEWGWIDAKCKATKSVRNDPVTFTHSGTGEELPYRISLTSEALKKYDGQCRQYWHPKGGSFYNWWDDCDLKGKVTFEIQQSGDGGATWGSLDKRGCLFWTGDYDCGGMDGPIWTCKSKGKAGFFSRRWGIKNSPPNDGDISHTARVGLKAFCGNKAWWTCTAKAAVGIKVKISFKLDCADCPLKQRGQTSAGGSDV